MSTYNRLPQAEVGNVFPSWCNPTRRPSRSSFGIVLQIPPDRPDLAIYSQEQQLALGLEPRWDNPDMVTHTNRPWKLLPEPLISIRNLSSTAGAVNAMVHLLTSDFGIGMPRIPLSTKVVSLPPGQQIQLSFALSQAILTGNRDVGFHVLIEHANDAQPINNRGSHIVVSIYTSEAGRELHLGVPSPATQEITLTILPNNLTTVVGDIPVPPETNYILTAIVPDTLHGTTNAPIRKEITVIGRNLDGTLIDGLTYIVFVDD